MDRWQTYSILLLGLLCLSDGQLIFGRPLIRIPLDHVQRDLRFFQPTRPIMKPTVSSSPRFTLLAPDLLRTDSQENIYLHADGVSSLSIPVSISIQDFSKKITLLQDSVTLTPQNKFQALKTIQISSDQLNRDEKKNKFVYLQVNFQGFHSEERVLEVNFHSGYIFIQTDKPIYNPGDIVRFRAFVSSPDFKAFDCSITIEIQNPDGVVVKQISRVRAEEGTFSEMFPLSEIVTEGFWVLTARFDHWQQNTFTSQFEVKKYVLPAFNVTLTPKSSFLSLDDKELAVEISAKYLYGQIVQGTAYVVFGVKINKDKIRLPTMKQVSELDEGVVRLSMDELKSAYPDIRSLVGHSIYVKASVLTNTGSDLVEAEKTGIKIVESPFVLNFKDMPKFYKPGLPLDFTIQVNHHDGSPARNVPVKLNLLDAPMVISGSARATINMPSEGGQQIITAETTQDRLRPEQQAKHQVSVLPYSAFDHRNKNYLYISTGTNTMSVGEQMFLRLHIATADQTHRDYIKHITYLVFSNGKIQTAERLDVSGQVETIISFSVTQAMMPSFRVVAFYSINWESREEVVSDSIWVDVKDSCVGGLKVGPVGVGGSDLLPGKSFKFQIRGDPGSKVSLVAVDNAVFLLNKERLTQKKIWDEVEGGDVGCTRGGGREASTVFSDAGILFSSSSGFHTQTRPGRQCSGPARRRRSPELVQKKAKLESHYKEKLLRRCCKDGLKGIPMPYSCTRRSLYITEGFECIRAFRYCCATYLNQEFDTQMPTTPLPTTLPPTTTLPTTTSAPLILSHQTPHFPILFARTMSFSEVEPVKRRLSAELDRLGMVKQYSKVNKMAEEEEFLREVVKGEAVTVEEEDEEDWRYLDESDVYLRSKFFESWLWRDVTLPTKVEGDGLASQNVDSVLPDSITEWGVLAVSASPHTGFCVADPYNVKAWKPFFVDLKLPYSVARNEKVEIKAVIHNYGEESLVVRVVLMKTEGVCSVAFKDRHTQEVTLAAGSSVAVPYVIVPLVVGKLPLEVMVLGRDTGGDRVQKFLRVVLDGVQKTEVRSVVLNPSAMGGNQTVFVGKVELESVVPNSEPETFINIIGNVLADSIDNSISEDSLASLIRMPGGCVEQNLASITLPLIATLYLERSEGWESVGVQRKAEAIRYIRRGYENQLAYKRPDGSYPPYRRQGASTWITAYVVKVLSMAHSIIEVNQKEVCDPLIYLVNNKWQKSDGRFKEDNPVYSTTMTGGLRGDDPETTLTAFVLIALAEARQAGITCQGSIIPMQTLMRKTFEYLRKAVMKSGRRPYTVAISSYALTLTDARRFNPTAALLSAAASDGSYWPDSKNTLFTLEATGYALLALVKSGDIERAAAPFQWLNSQRRKGGGFGSTQSTMVVLQALSGYLINHPTVDLSLDVDVRIKGRKEIRYHFNPGTAFVARSSRLPANLDLNVVAQGKGQGILEVVTYYNQLQEVDEKKPCKDFELSVIIEEADENPPADVETSYLITINVRALGPADVRMVVLDISLPTGFTPENSDLEMLSNSVDRYISNFQIVDNLSDRGSLIIHLFKVSHKEPEILIFRLQQRFKVGLLQPSSVTVYEYYNPDHRCSRSYTPVRPQQELTRICTDNICRCTQGDCCISKTDGENFPITEREMFACKSAHHVFQVKVLNGSQSYYDKFLMEIARVIQLGVEAGVEVGQKRIFMSHGGCREGLNLQQGSQYLIMGPKEDQWNIDSETNSVIYMLGKNTWVERWPSSEECSKNVNLRDKCITLDSIAEKLSVDGCKL